MLVAFPRWCSGNLFAAIDINTMLSIPKIISRKVNVINAKKASEESRKSNIYFCILYAVPFSTLIALFCFLIANLYSNV